jgi:predicted protein tyrosine phosphatase
MQNKESLTQAIFSSGCPYNNMYQGNDKRVLFVCSAGILRSATGARIYAKKYNTRACGTHHYALIPLSANLILWADEIVFVNMENHAVACRKFDMDEYDGQVKILNIPDDYDHMHPELIQHFIKQYEPLE